MATPRSCSAERDDAAALADWLARCERLHPKDIELTLDRVHTVKDRLGLAFTAPVVVVAGTNGKGSSCAMLEQLARSSGLRVGLYSKPHLVRFEERCRVDGQEVTAGALLPHFERVERARGDISLTYFEFTTLAIASLLAETPLDLVVLEVGLGGRLDAVNVFDADCALITSIDVDHTEFLGETREAIGHEKAGIMRAGRPVVVSDPQPPLSVHRHAARLGAEPIVSGREFSFVRGRQSWHWSSPYRAMQDLPLPALRGAQQVQNAAGVIAVLHRLRRHLPFNEEAIRHGLTQVRWPGRFQVVEGPRRLILDVAHNRQSVQALFDGLAEMVPSGPVHAVFGCMRDKEVETLLRIALPRVSHWWFCDLPTPRAAAGQALHQHWRALCAERGLAQRAAVFADPSSACRAAVAHAPEEATVLVFGSFYTVGGVMADATLLPATAQPLL